MSLQSCYRPRCHRPAQLTLDKMLAPIKHALSAHRVILASSSARRQELVQNLGVRVDSIPSIFEENLNPCDFPSLQAFVEDTAYYKALDVWSRVHKPSDIGNGPCLVIAADTIVALDGKVYGKPGTKEKAVEMLAELSGRAHHVYTGVVIKHNKGEVRFCETTKVYFGKITAEQIQAYVDTGEPLDKAGGYGIQGIGGSMVERIEGDYFTVVGLPLYKLCFELCKIFNYSIK